MRGVPLIVKFALASAIILVGVLLLAAGGIFKQRWAVQKAAGRRPKALVTAGVALLELLGPASIWEGLTRRRLLTGAPLGDRQAGELMGAGLVYTLTLVAASGARLMQAGVARAQAAFSVQAPKAPALVDQGAQLLRRLQRTGATRGAVQRWAKAPEDLKAVTTMIRSLREAGLGGLTRQVAKLTGQCLFMLAAGSIRTCQP